MSKSLIVIDFQNDFVDGSLGTKEAQKIIPLVAKKVKNALENNVFVYFTLDTHKEGYLDTLEGKNLPVVHCMKGTHGHELNTEISSLLENYVENKDYKILEKEYFSSTALLENIKDEEVEMIGICTDICVVSNALLLKAHFPNMSITVDSSCCAGVTPQKHEAALEVLKSCQLSVV